MPPVGLLGPSLAWELVAALRGSGLGAIELDPGCTIHLTPRLWSRLLLVVR